MHNNLQLKCHFCYHIYNKIATVGLYHYRSMRQLFKPHYSPVVCLSIAKPHNGFRAFRIGVLCFNTKYRHTLA